MGNLRFSHIVMLIAGVFFGIDLFVFVEKFISIEEFFIGVGFIISLIVLANVSEKSEIKNF